MMMPGIPALDLLRELVSIHSGTANIVGVNRVQQIIHRELSAIGFTNQWLENPGATENSERPTASARMLVGELAGQTNRFITFVTHADTVEPGLMDTSRFEISGDRKRAFGRGVIDDKGGQVVALKGLERFLTSLGPVGRRYSLRFISSPSEEVGSTGFHEVLARFGKDSDYILGFEPALDGGSIIKARRGNRWYHVRIEGVEAHSGRAHELSVNAGSELVAKLSAIDRLTSYKSGVTVSIGHLHGGKDTFNISCGFAEAKLDARFPSLSARDKLDRKIQLILKKSYVQSHATRTKAKTQYEIVDDCPPFEANPNSLAAIKEYLAIIREIENHRVGCEVSGGAADTCFMTHPKAVVIDGLGPVGGKMHTGEEYIDLASLESRASALEKFLLRRNTAPKLTPSRKPSKKTS